MSSANTSKDPSDLFRALPKAGEELDKDARSLIENQSSLEKLLSWKMGERPLTDTEVKAAQYLMASSYKGVAQSAIKAVESGDPEDLIHFSQMIDTFGYVRDTRSGASSEAGRALNAYKIGADLSNTTVEDFTKMLGDRGRVALAEDALKAAGGKEKTMDMARAMKAISEMSDEQVIAAVEASSQAAKGGFTKSTDAIASVAINGMLSSPKVFVGNMLSNAITTGNSVLTTYMSSIVGKVRGTEGAVTLAEGNSYIRGMMGSLMEGFNSMGQALRAKPAGPANAVKADLLDISNPISAKAMGIPTDRNLGYKMLGKMADGTGLAVGLPSRINAAPDAFFSTIMYRGRINQLAVAEAAEKGLGGAERAAFIESRVSKPTVTMHEDAKAFAKENVFSQALDPDSLTGKAQDIINNKVPLGKVLFPFFRTAVNITDYTIQHSPLAPLISSETKAAFAAGGKAKDVAIAKIALGSTFLGAMTYMAAEGIVTGPEPKNFKVKRALEETGFGWQPDSVLVGDTYHSIKSIEPMSAFVRLGAVMSMLSTHLDDSEMDEVAKVGASAVMDFMTPEMMVDSYSKFFEAYNEASGNGGDGKVKAVTIDFASRFIPYSGLLKSIRNETDPLKRAASGIDGFTDSLMARFKNTVPWLSEDLPVQRNMFGEPLYIPDGVGPDMISPITTSNKDSSAVSTKLADLAQYYNTMGPKDGDLNPLSLSMPAQYFDFKGYQIKLNPKQYERYVMYSAGLNPETGESLNGITPLREVLSQTLEGFQRIDNKMNTKTANKLIGSVSGIIGKYKKLGKQMMVQDEDVMNSWNSAVESSLQEKTIDVFQPSPNNGE